MQVNGVDLVNATAAGRDPNTPASDKLGRNDFLKLLMAQMQNQDPMNPQDNQAFLQQLAQFASLEQQQNTNKSLEDLISMTGAGNSANAVSLLGRDVRMAGNDIRGPKATLHYQLQDNATEVTIEIRSKDGRIVKTLTDQPGGKNLQTVEVEGLPQEDLKFYVRAKDAKGKEVKSALSYSEKVQGVNFAGTTPILLTGSGRELPVTNLVEIRMPATPPASAPAHATPPAPADVPTPDVPPPAEGENNG